MAGDERLQKVLARAGVASRRKAEELIVAGRVEVNGAIVTELGTKVDPGRDLIRVDGQLIGEPESHAYFVLYKPPRVLTTLGDPEGRPTVGDYLNEIEGRVYPLGRLDYMAEGAVILTNDGDLANKLMHPRFGVRRTYLVKVKGSPDAKSLAQLREGVRLEDGMAQAADVEIESHTGKNTWLKMVFTDGRPHLAYRLCAAVGHPAARVFRADFGGVSVGGMESGSLRELSAREVQRLRDSADGVAMPPPRVGPPARVHGHEPPRPEGGRIGPRDRPAAQRHEAPGGRREAPGGRREAPGGRREAPGGRREAPGGRRPSNRPK